MLRRVLDTLYLGTAMVLPLCLSPGERMPVKGVGNTPIGRVLQQLIWEAKQFRFRSSLLLLQENYQPTTLFLYHAANSGAPSSCDQLRLESSFEEHASHTATSRIRKR